MSDANTQQLSALARALISGYVDSYALLNFGVFASFMTGNTTTGGLNAGQANLAAAGHSLLPIPFFLLGILAGSLVVRADQHRALRRLSLLVAVMLAVGAARAYFVWPGSLGIMLLSSAMGLLNTSVTQVGGQAVSLGFMTGDLNNLAQHLAQGIVRAPVAQAQDSRDTHWRRAALLGSLWIFFLAGAVLGGALASRVAVWTLLLPAMVLLLLALLEPAIPFLAVTLAEAGRRGPAAAAEKSTCGVLLFATDIRFSNYRVLAHNLTRNAPNPMEEDIRQHRVDAERVTFRTALITLHCDLRPFPVPASSLRCAQKREGDFLSPTHPRPGQSRASALSYLNGRLYL